FFFLDLTKSCVSLTLWRCWNVTPEAIDQLYTNMIEGSTKLRQLDILTPLPYDDESSFFKLCGISFGEGRVYSSKDIQAFQSEHRYEGFCFFDGNLEIKFTGSGVLHFELHDTQ
ncbi:hypothetical protein PENTCL1PPCAC_12584, partial [Pristionchus entomophagus]